MTTATVERMPNQVAEVRLQLENMQGQFKAALPAHIPVERFGRVVMTALQNTPDLLNCDRRSLWNAAMKAAQDGLLPDGREGAIVKYGTTAQWMPMIAGLRKKVRNSGEIATWDAHVVHENDNFEYRLGDDPLIVHFPALSNPGKVIAAYSVATLKSGEKSREVMSIEQIEKIRERSKAKNSGPWVTDFEEMCRKTVARRHAKSLPMSTDIDEELLRVIHRDDDWDDPSSAREERTVTIGRPQSLSGRLDAIASSTPSQPEDAVEKELIEKFNAEDAATETEPTLPLADSEFKYDSTAKFEGAAAYKQGVQRRAIPGEYRDPSRKEDAEKWQAGWDAAKAEDDARDQ